MKVGLAQFIYETNTFNPEVSDLAVFTEGGIWLTDEAAVRVWCASNDSQLSGSLRVLEQAGVSAHPVWVAVSGTPGGRLSAACLDSLRHALRTGLATVPDLEVIILHLHGAACAVGEDDIEGNLLTLVRSEMGFSGRLVLSLDLHALVTPRMLQHVDALTAYRTMPHQDFLATGERAACLALDPTPSRLTLARVPALLPPTDTQHASGHFAAMLDRAREIERLPGIKDVALFPVQPWFDVEGLSSSVVITSSPTAPAAEAARQLAETWYADRHRWQTGLRPWPEIHAALRQRRPKPWILVDTADATTGGSSGASPEAVRQLWSLRDDLPGDVLLWVVDPEAFAAAAQGATTFDLGTPAFPLTASVRGLHEGSFQARGRSYTGQTFNVGPSAVLQAGRLFIVVSSRGALVADPAFYTCVGLDPDTALAVHVKSLMGWKAGYEADSDRALIFDGPGATSLNFARLPYTGERRNLFPIDPLATPNPTPWQSN